MEKDFFDKEKKLEKELQGDTGEPMMGSLPNSVSLIYMILGWQRDTMCNTKYTWARPKHSQ